MNDRRIKAVNSHPLLGVELRYDLEEIDWLEEDKSD